MYRIFIIFCACQLNVKLFGVWNHSRYMVFCHVYSRIFSVCLFILQTTIALIGASSDDPIYSIFQTKQKRNCNYVLRYALVWFSWWRIFACKIKFNCLFLFIYLCVDHIFVHEMIIAIFQSLLDWNTVFNYRHLSERLFWSVRPLILPFSLKDFIFSAIVKFYQVFLF